MILIYLEHMAKNHTLYKKHTLYINVYKEYNKVYITDSIHIYIYSKYSYQSIIRICICQYSYTSCNVTNKGRINPSYKFLVIMNRAPEIYKNPQT